MKLGLHASAFDPIHPGYLYAWHQALDAGACDGIVAAIHADPSTERSEKRRPAMTVKERIAILEQFRVVQTVCVYVDERQLYEMIRSTRPACLIIGEDHEFDRVTGADLAPVFWAKRNPEWSGTQIARRIAASLPDVAASLRFTEGLDPEVMARYPAQDLLSIHAIFKSIGDAFDRHLADRAARGCEPGQM
jgi:glycerol-3-phosphate cytidylyltransferase-like family protein